MGGRKKCMPWRRPVVVSRPQAGKGEEGERGGRGGKRVYLDGVAELGFDFLSKGGGHGRVQAICISLLKFVGHGGALEEEREGGREGRTGGFCVSKMATSGKGEGGGEGGEGGRERGFTCAITLAMAPVPTKPTEVCFGEDPKYLTAMPPAAPVRRSVMKRFSWKTPKGRVEGGGEEGREGGRIKKAGTRICTR